MQKHRVVQFGAAFALIAAMAIAAFGTTALAKPAVTNVTTSATKAARHLQVSNVHTVDMSKVPAASTSALTKASRSLPALFPAGQKAHKAAQHAKSSSVTPKGTGVALSGSSAALPSIFNKWDGQKDSAATCPYFGGCQPPDMGIAANEAGQVMQSVNSSLAFYDVNGTIQSGWPKTAQVFFGVPNPSPAGCDAAFGNQPFLSDPRSWYDPFKQRWGQAELQVEDAFGLAADCNFVTRYWVAISNTSNPNGAWTIFAINMAFGSDPTGTADYTQFGFDSEGIFFSANMFNQAGTAYDYAEIVGCGYPAKVTTCNGWFNLTVTGPGGRVAIDTVNPSVDSINAGAGPGAELFASSFNSPDPFGNNCISAACHGATVWAWADPIGANTLSGKFVNTNTYLEPPGSDQPGCTGGAGCVESLDTRFSATPYYHNGNVYTAHVTGFTNRAAQFVPAIQWFRFRATLNSSGQLTALVDAEDNYLAGSGSFTSLTFPVMAATMDGNILMGYDYMSDTVFPSIGVTSKHSTDPDGVWTGGLGFLPVVGTVNTTNDRWGDFEAMGYVGAHQDFIWFASQYPNPSTGDWNTKVMRLKLASPRA